MQLARTPRAVHPGHCLQEVQPRPQPLSGTSGPDSSPHLWSNLAAATRPLASARYTPSMAATRVPISGAVSGR